MIPALSTLSLTNIPSLLTLIVSSIFIQPAAALACGVLARLGTLNPLLALGIIFSTDIVMDCVWYALGRHHGERTWRFVTRLFGIDDVVLGHVTRAFHAHPGKIIITSKILGGLGIMPAILFTAGTSRMNFRRYLILNMTGEILWSTALVAVGYFFSNWYLQVSDTIGKASIIMLFVVLVGVALWVGHVMYGRVIDETDD